MSTPNPYASPALPPVVPVRSARLPWWFWAICLLAMGLGVLGALPVTLVLYRTAAGPQGAQHDQAEEWAEFDAKWFPPALVFSVFHLAVCLTLTVGLLFSLRRRGEGRRILAVECWSGVLCQFASVFFLGALLQDFISNSWHVQGPIGGSRYEDEFWRGMQPVFAWAIFVSAGLALIGALLDRVRLRGIFDELAKNRAPSDEC